MNRFITGPFSLPTEVIKGIDLINSSEFFIAHEILENAWRKSPMPIRQMYQGLVQYSVARLHIQNNNRRGALKTLIRSTMNLEPFENADVGLKMTILLSTIQTIINRNNATTAGSISAVVIGIPLIEIEA